MNRQRIPNKLILGIAGVSLLLLGAFPQILWASSHGDRLLIKGTIGDLSLVFANQSHGRHQPPPERRHYRGKNKHRRPVVTTTTTTTTTTYRDRDHRRPSPGRGYNHPGYHWLPRGHRHQQPKHYYKNKHRHPRADHYNWSRWNRW